MDALAEVVYDLCLEVEEALSEGPAPSRVRLRDLRAKLERHYKVLRVNEVDLAQHLAEEDGDAIEDTI